MDLDDFGDDDLDALPDNTLRALEEIALASTQRPNPPSEAKQAAHPSIRNNNTTTALGQQPTRASSWRAPQPAQHVSKSNAPPPGAPDLPSSDYGFEDEDVIDLNEAEVPQLPAKNGIPSRPLLASRPTSLPPNRHQQQQRASRPPLDPETEAAFAAADAELGTHRPGQWSEAAAGAAASHSIDDDATNGKSGGRKGGGGGNVNALQARIAELESEQRILREAATQFRDAMLSKQGEISIVRANQDKAAKEYERRIAVMQKLHADEAAKQKAELDAGRKEREKMETDNRFLQHDLRQEAERSKRLTGPPAGAGGKMRSLVNGGQGKAATPQKAKRQHTLGDGFEDTEVLRVSPSKNNNSNRENSAEHTPKTGSKRKRVAQDSPAPVLSFSPASAPTQKINGEQSEHSLRPTGGETAHARDDRYEGMLRMMNHIPNGKDRRSVEALSQFAFPSSPDVTLASMLIKGVSAISLQGAEDPFALKASRALLSIWRGCLAHKYYSPLPLVLDLLRSVLCLELPSTVATLIEEAVPLCTEAICLVAVPTAGVFSANPAFAASVGQKVSAELRTWVDVDEMMDFLHDLSDAAASSPERAETFWRTMEFHFTMLMLNKAQPLYQILTGLKILSASAFETTFGSIAAAGAEEQMIHERGTIDRLMNLLTETPQVPDGEPAYTAEETAELRIEVLAVLRALCLTPHGGEALARHVTAIGRLLSFLDSQVRSLYTIRPSIGLATGTTLTAENETRQHRQQPRTQQTPPVGPPVHNLVAQAINTTVLLLHHLLRTHNDLISFPAKTSAVKGGHHRFIVAMTRIAFSDQLVFEAGISDAAVEAAHSILDEILNPEEGEAIMMAVETPRGTRSSAATTTGHDHPWQQQQKEKRKGDGTEDGEEDAEMLDAG